MQFVMAQKSRDSSGSVDGVESSRVESSRDLHEVESSRVEPRFFRFC